MELKELIDVLNKVTKNWGEYSLVTKRWGTEDEMSLEIEIMYTSHDEPQIPIIIDKICWKFNQEVLDNFMDENTITSEVEKGLISRFISRNIKSVIYQPKEV